MEHVHDMKAHLDLLSLPRGNLGSVGVHDIDPATKVSLQVHVQCHVHVCVYMNDCVHVSVHVYHVCMCK